MLSNQVVVVVVVVVVDCEGNNREFRLCFKWARQSAAAAAAAARTAESYDS